MVVSARLGSEWGGSCDCSFLEGGVGVLVDVRCLGRLVAEPQRDRRDVDVVGAQEHGVGMAQGVRCDAFRWQRRAGDGSGGDVSGDDRADGVAAERPALPGGEQRLVGLAAAEFGEPGAYDRDGFVGQRG